MQVSIRTIAIVGTLIAGSLAYLSFRVDSLKQDLKESQEIVEIQGKAIEDVKTSISNLNLYQKQLKDSIDTMKLKNKELNDTLQYKDKLLTDKSLADKIVTESFNQFSQDVQELTK